MSLAVTRVLLPTRITPNQFTVLSSLLGFAAMWLVVQSTWMAIGGAVGFLFYNVILCAQLLVVHKSGSPFAFRWWFQKQDTYLENTLSKGGLASRLGEVFHATGRRDVLVFAWMLFALARLPQAIVVWFAIIAAVHGGMAVIHVLAGGMSRRRSIERLES